MAMPKGKHRYAFYFRWKLQDGKVRSDIDFFSTVKEGKQRAEALERHAELLLCDHKKLF